MIKRFRTAQELHDHTALEMWSSPAEGDRDRSASNQRFDCWFRVDSFDTWDYDLRDLWLHRSRWTKLIRDYLTRQAIDDWVDRLGEDEEPVVLVPSEIQIVGVGKGTRRRWGNCLLHLTFRTEPEPRITLHSRASILGMLAPLDINVAYNFARLASQKLDIPLKQIGFDWIVDMLVMHSFKSAPWVLNHPELLADVIDMSDGIKEPDTLVQRGLLHQFNRWRMLDDAGVLYSQEKFATKRRARSKYHSHVLGKEYSQRFADERIGPSLICPSVHINTLDFSGVNR